MLFRSAHRYGASFLITCGCFCYGAIVSSWAAANVTCDTSRASARKGFPPFLLLRLADSVRLLSRYRCHGWQHGRTHCDMVLPALARPKLHPDFVLPRRTPPPSAHCSSQETPSTSELPQSPSLPSSVCFSTSTARTRATRAGRTTTCSRTRRRSSSRSLASTTPSSGTGTRTAGAKGS